MRFRPYRKGGTTVEMAFVAPFVFLLVFGSIEFSRMMMIRQALTNAAREGARHACLVNTNNASNSEQVIRDTLRGVVAGHDDADIVRVEFDPPFTETLSPGTEIVASVEVDCSDVSWIPPMFFSGAVIRGSSTMKRE